MKKTALLLVMFAAVFFIAEGVFIASGARAENPGSEPGPQGILTSKQWRLESFTFQGVLWPVLQGVQATALFTEDGAISGSGSCNSYFGTYSFGEGQTIAMGQIASTMMACMQDVMDQENLFFSSLQRTTFFEWDGWNLRLYQSDERESLNFVEDVQAEGAAPLANQ